MSYRKELHKLWIQTYTGQQFYPFNVDPSMINIEDICHSLASQVRYNGHLDLYYSVAEHSVYVSHLVPPEHALTALLHDATEAYIGDVPAPVKRGLPDFEALEDYIYEFGVAPKFGLPPKLPECVKAADFDVFVREYNDLVTDYGHKWICHGMEPPSLQAVTGNARIISTLERDAAKKYFMDRFTELTTVDMKESA